MHRRNFSSTSVGDFCGPLHSKWQQLQRVLAQWLLGRQFHLPREIYPAQGKHFKDRRLDLTYSPQLLNLGISQSLYRPNREDLQELPEGP